jgi:solute:Na+ symporter, SSS family
MSSLFGAIYLNAAQMSNVTIVLIYSAALVIVTSLISLRSKDPDPMLAGRNMPWWLVAGSIVGTCISSIAFLGSPGLGHAQDFNYIFSYSIGSTIGMAVVIVYFIRFVRQSRNASIYTLLGDRFGHWASIYASVSFIVYSILRMGVISCLVATAVHSICGTDILSVMALCGLMVIFYTYMSGIEGVIWTDLFQTVFFLVAGIASILFLYELVPHTPTVIFNLDNQREAWAGGTIFTTQGWPVLLSSIVFWCFVGVDYGTNQGFAQRYLVARSEKHAKWGAAIGGILIPLVAIIFFSIGLFLYVFYEGQLSAGVPESSGVFAHFITNHFPDGLKGLAIVGILAAAMSTIDTGINSSSTVLICNLYEPFVKTPIENKSLFTLQILRFSSLLFGVAGIFAAYAIYLHGGDILKSFWIGLGVINGGIISLFVLMRLSKQAGHYAGIVTVITGSAMTIPISLKWGIAGQVNEMLGLPIGVTVGVLAGLICSRFLKNDKRGDSQSHFEISAKAKQEISANRRRTKKNVFADSLRPKPFYRFYCAIAAAVGVVMILERERLGTGYIDNLFIAGGIALLIAAAVVPFFVENRTNKRYIGFNLTCLGLALPFLGALALFSRPEQDAAGYFYLATLLGMGTIVGWTMLSLVSMIATSFAAQLAVVIYPQAGIPDNWSVIAMGALAVYTYFAMQAAKEVLVTERTLAQVHTIVGKIFDKVQDVSVELMKQQKALGIKEVDRIAHVAGDVKNELFALMGATDINPKSSQMELSVKETLEHVLSRFPQKLSQAVTLIGKDFKVLGDRDIFENVVTKVLENAFYYVTQGTATQVKCELDDHHYTLSIANNGPTVHPDDVPYLFDLGYVSGKQGLGLGLTYSKKMLETMRSGIRLISKYKDPWTRFRLYFPKYAELPETAGTYPLRDDE